MAGTDPFEELYRLIDAAETLAGDLGLDELERRLGDARDDANRALDAHRHGRNAR